jgi:hypothetical protein
LQAAREKAAVNAAKARAYRREEVIKRCKRVEKLLRQVDDVKAKATAGVQLNADQKAKVSSALTSSTFATQWCWKR